MPFDKLPLAMDVLADMYRHSLLDQAEIDRERTVVQQEIPLLPTSPAPGRRSCWRARRSATSRSAGLSPGTIDTVEAMRRDDFVRHVARLLRAVEHGAQRRREHDARRGAAPGRRPFGDLPDGDVPASPAAVTQFAPDRVVVETREIAQCNMGIALHALPRNDPDRYPLMVLNTILGRGMSSRLFKEVRERRGLAYSVGSGVSRYNDIGTMSISAGVTLDHLEEATQVIRDQLFRMRDELASEEELTKARDFSTGNFRLGLESTMALAQRAGEMLLMTGEIEPIEDVVASIAAVTPAEVQRVAQRLFKPGGFSMAVVGRAATPVGCRRSSTRREPAGQRVSRSACQPVSVSACQPVSRSAGQPVSVSARSAGQPVSVSACQVCGQHVSRSAGQRVSVSACQCQPVSTGGMRL